jgi:hypothetical protein
MKICARKPLAGRCRDGRARDINNKSLADAAQRRLTDRSSSLCALPLRVVTTMGGSVTEGRGDMVRPAKSSDIVAPFARWLENALSPGEARNKRMHETDRPCAE